MSLSYVISPEPTLIKLEDSPIWREACDIAELMYNKLGDLPESEKWDTTAKLQHEANDLMLHVSHAVGGSSVNSNEYDWSSARKSVSALKTIYRFAGRQKFIELEPEIMVRFDKLIVLIDQEIIKTYKQSEADKEKDLDYWQEKYKLWKATEI